MPVVTTYHGSDINNQKVYLFSRWSIKLSKWNIFVSQPLIAKANPKHRFSLIPCGIDIELLCPMDKQKCRSMLNMDIDKHYVLFSKNFATQVKNYPLAKAAMEQMTTKAES